MPNITIDDRPISVPNGTLIVQAARMLGIEVPVFCYHSRLSSVGMCRMCLVEVGTPRMGPDRNPVLKPDGTPEIAFAQCAARFLYRLAARQHRRWKGHQPRQAWCAGSSAPSHALQLGRVHRVVPLNTYSHKNEMLIRFGLQTY